MKMKPETKLMSILAWPVQKLRRSKRSKSTDVEDNATKTKPKSARNPRIYFPKNLLNAHILIGEIDRCVKRTRELVSHFDQIWLKINPNGNVKDCKNVRTELQRDTKKLQAQKKEIMDRISRGQGKDYRLLDAKRLVESYLSRVKGIEKQGNQKRSKPLKRIGATAARRCNQSQFLQGVPQKENFKPCIGMNQKATTAMGLPSEAELSSEGKIHREVRTRTTRAVTRMGKSSEGDSKTTLSAITVRDALEGNEKSELRQNQSQNPSSTRETDSSLEKVKSWLTTTLSEFENLIRSYEKSMDDMPLNSDEKLLSKLYGRCSMHRFQKRKLEKLSESIRNLPRDLKNLQNFFSLVQQTKIDVEKYLRKSEEEFVALQVGVENTIGEAARSEPSNQNKPVGNKTCEGIQCNLSVMFTHSGITLTATSRNQSKFKLPAEGTLDEDSTKSMYNFQKRGKETKRLPEKQTQLRLPMRGTSRRSRIINRLSANPHDAQFLLARRRLLERRESRRPRRNMKPETIEPNNRKRNPVPDNFVYLPMMAQPDHIVP